MVEKSKAYKIAKYAITFATIFIAMMIDRVISLGLPTSTAACVLLVTLSFCFIDNDWVSAVISCTLFGVASFAKEFIFPTGVAALPIYVWPIVTVLPRAVMGFVAFGAYRIMLSLLKRMRSAYRRQTVAITVGCFFGLVTNTVLFLTALNVCKGLAGEETSSIIAVITAVILTNILPEYLISMLLCPHLVLGVRRGRKLGINGNDAAADSDSSEQRNKAEQGNTNQKD